MSKSVKSRVLTTTARKPIPAVVIDVVGQLCSVKLSGSSTVLRGIYFTGRVPKKGDTVLVEFGRGDPTAQVSDKNETQPPKVEASDTPVINASTLEIMVPTEPSRTNEAAGTFRGYWDSESAYIAGDFVRDGDEIFMCMFPNENITTSDTDYWACFGLFTGGEPYVFVRDNLTSQVDGLTSHFYLNTISAPFSIKVYVNGLLIPSDDIALDEDMLGFETEEPLLAGDFLEAEYEQMVLHDEDYNILVDDQGNLLME